MSCDLSCRCLFTPFATAIRVCTRSIDQNPVYYEFMLEANYRTERVANITDHVIARSHRRYGLAAYNDDVAQAWSMLVASAYSQDLSVQDGTGIPHLPGGSSQFKQDRKTPSATLCTIYNAWGRMISAAAAIDPALETFRYKPLFLYSAS